MSWLSNNGITVTIKPVMTLSSISEEWKNKYGPYTSRWDEYSVIPVQCWLTLKTVRSTNASTAKWSPLTCSYLRYPHPLLHNWKGSSLVCDLAFDADCYLRRKDTPANTTAIGYEYLVLWGVHMAKRCRYEGDFGRMNRCKCCEGKAFLGSSSFHSLSGCNHAENFDDIHVPSEYMFVLKQWQSGPQGRIRAVRAANWFRKLHVLRPRSTLYEPV